MYKRTSIRLSNNLSVEILQPEENLVIEKPATYDILLQKGNHLELKERISKH